MKTPLRLSYSTGNLTMTTLPSVLTDELVDMKFITEYSKLTDKWFYQLIKDGEFPKPIKLGRSSRWLRSEVETWFQKRIDESRQ